MLLSRVVQGGQDGPTMSFIRPKIRKNMGKMHQDTPKLEPRYAMMSGNEPKVRQTVIRDGPTAR